MSLLLERLDTTSCVTGFKLLHVLLVSNQIYGLRLFICVEFTNFISYFFFLVNRSTTK